MKGSTKKYEDQKMSMFNEICINVFIYVLICIYVFIYTHTHTYIYIYIYMKEVWIDQKLNSNLDV